MKVMKRVYVTEGGFFDEDNCFNGTGVIGVDSKPRSAVYYPLTRNYKRLRIYRTTGRHVVIYKQYKSNKGLRITAIDME